MAFDIRMIKEVYSKFEERVNAAKKLTGKPLILVEKIYIHTYRMEIQQRLFKEEKIM